MADEDFASFDIYVGIVVQRLEFSMHDFVQLTSGVNAYEFLELGHDIVSLANLMLDAINRDRHFMARMGMVVPLQAWVCSLSQLFHGVFLLTCEFWD
ncbi:MAG: hypothetical protein WBX13_03775 [Candidatus Acidiferrales bacterium]